MHTNIAQRMQAVFQGRAIVALSERLHASLTSLQGNARADMERLLETQQELQQRGVQLRMVVSCARRCSKSWHCSRSHDPRRDAQFCRWAMQLVGFHSRLALP